MDKLYENLFDDDLDTFEPEVSDKLGTFASLMDPHKLSLELERRGFQIDIENSNTVYRYCIGKAEMHKLRLFAEKKLLKFNDRGSARKADTVKGCMGELAWVMLLRAYLDIFGLDPQLAKVNLKVTPVNDGGNDTLIGGFKVNVKYANNPSSGIFMGLRDLSKVMDSHYYVLVNGENINSNQLFNSNIDSYPVVISGGVCASELVQDNMTHRLNASKQDRWVYEKKNMMNVDSIILTILNGLSIGWK